MSLLPRECALAIVYETTDNTPDNIPWPPVGEDYYWVAVSYDLKHTRWRRVGIIPQAEGSDRPAPGVGRFAKFRRAAAERKLPP
jgi:hypothetical protein